MGINELRRVVLKGGLLETWESGRTPLRVQQSFKRRDGSKGLAKRLLLGQPFDTRGWDVTDTREDTKYDED